MAHRRQPTHTQGYGDAAAILRLIRAKRARLGVLEREARALRAKLSAVSDTVRAESRQRARGLKTSQRPVWPTSVAGRAVAALRQARRPMRVGDILRAIRRSSGTRMTRATLVGQLARDVRNGRLFRRTAPNEYALAGWSRGRRPPP